MELEKWADILPTIAFCSMKLSATIIPSSSDLREKQVEAPLLLLTKG